MKHGVYVPNFGPFGDAAVMADLARRAEAAGWDGVFVWDHVIRHEGDFDLVDPWVALTAMAVATERVTIGPLITPLPRRRPWNVAKSAVNVDRLSGGRLVLGVGIGSDRGREFSGFGEVADPKTRGDMLDEAIALIHQIWTGEPIHHEGRHYPVDDGIRFLPAAPGGRIPIWVASEGVAPRPVRRAAGLEGVFPIGITPDDLTALLALIDAEGPRPDRYDIVVTGEDDSADWDDTAVTWWLRRVPWDEPLDATVAIVDAGPPRSS
jgi:alkanesulfonate monooxygenase SsuD/methylene tetrahydromethanopterin reductase-like flavin-dependent oxidoreductase (luciferase family)